MALADEFQNKTGYAGSRETGVSGLVRRDVQYFRPVCRIHGDPYLVGLIVQQALRNDPPCGEITGDWS